MRANKTEKIVDVAWYDVLTPAYRVIEVSDQDRATVDGTEKVKRVEKCCVRVEINASASDPLITLAPDVDYSYEILLCCREDNVIQYEVKGTHDGWPAYSLWIGGELVHAYDAIKEDTDSWSMFGSSDIQISESGVVQAKCDCENHKSHEDDKDEDDDTSDR